MGSIAGVLFDIDGVLVTSWEPIPGASDAVRWVRERDLSCAFLTNTTSRTREQIADALTSSGIEVFADEIVTAATLTADHLRSVHPGARCVVVNSGPIAEDLAGVDVADPAGGDPDVVVLGGAGPEFTHEVLSRVYDWMSRGIPVVAMHRSALWSTSDGLRIDTGMYLTGMEAASGRRATAVGKPAPWGFRASAERMGLDPEYVVMVGDDLDNDVLAAQVVGMQGVLVRTGKFRQDRLDRQSRDQYAMQPTHVVDSVADLPRVLALDPGEC